MCIVLILTQWYNKFELFDLCFYYYNIIQIIVMLQSFINISLGYVLQFIL